MNVYRRNTGQLNMSSRWVVGGQRHSLLPYTRKRALGTHLTEGWRVDGSQSLCERLRRKKSSMKCSRAKSHIKMQIEKYLALAGHGTRDLPARSLVTILNVFSNVLHIN